MINNVLHFLDIKNKDEYDTKVYYKGAEIFIQHKRKEHEKTYNKQVKSFKKAVEVIEKLSKMSKPLDVAKFISSQMEEISMCVANFASIEELIKQVDTKVDSNAFSTCVANIKTGIPYFIDFLKSDDKNDWDKFFQNSYNGYCKLVQYAEGCKNNICAMNSLTMWTIFLEDSLKRVNSKAKINESFNYFLSEIKKAKNVLIFTLKECETYLKGMLQDKGAVGFKSLLLAHRAKGFYLAYYDKFNDTLVATPRDTFISEADMKTYKIPYDEYDEPRKFSYVFEDYVKTQYYSEFLEVNLTTTQKYLKLSNLIK